MSLFARIARFSILAILTLLLGCLTATDALAGYIPPVNDGTGAFNRVVSNSDLGFQYMSASIYLPGNNNGSGININTNPAFETAYIYMGGVGNALNVGQGSVDAGFQYSQAHDNYTLFLTAEGVPGGQHNSTGTRFDASQTIQIQFSVSAPTTPGGGANLTIAAQGLVGGVLTQESVTVQNDPNWVVGGLSTLERVTALAQTSGQETFTDGSYLHGVQWSNVMIGTSSATASLWTSADTIADQSNPSPLTKPGVVNETVISPSNNVVTINLGAASVPEPSSLALCGVGLLGVLSYCRSRRTRTAS
jgi:hypothetical protein